MMMCNVSGGDLGLGAQTSAAEPHLCLQEQVRQGERFLQPLAGWEAAELGPVGARFLALQAQLTEFSRALAQRRQWLADAERLSCFFKQVCKGPVPGSGWSAGPEGWLPSSSTA